MNEPTVTEPPGPQIHRQVLTSSSFRSVPKANRLLNSLSITWRAWSPQGGRDIVSDPCEPQGRDGTASAFNPAASLDAAALSRQTSVSSWKWSCNP